MEREERGYFAYRKFGGRLVIVLHLCLERVQRGEKMKWQRRKGRKLDEPPLPLVLLLDLVLVTPPPPSRPPSFSLYFHSQIEAERFIYYRYY